MNDDHILKYAKVIIGKKKPRIKIINININKYDNNGFGADYRYLDEDNISMSSYLYFSKKIFNNYIRNLKLKKLNEFNI